MGPFVRRLPEFRFWKKSFRGVLVALVCTLFGFLDIPVFWPVLVLYFFILFGLTMKRQISHMIKHKYIPFSWGKKKYGRHEPIRKTETRPGGYANASNYNQNRYTARPVMRPPARGKR